MRRVHINGSSGGFRNRPLGLVPPLISTVSAAVPSGVVSSTENAGGAITPPRLRGWLHLTCFVLAVPTAFVLVAVADTARARVGVAIYAVGLVALFGVSGLYHRGRWSPAWKAIASSVRISSSTNVVCP